MWYALAWMGITFSNGMMPTINFLSPAIMTGFATEQACADAAKEMARTYIAGVFRENAKDLGEASPIFSCEPVRH